MIDTVRQDIADARRRLRQAPGITLVAVATLALGIGATTAIFSVVDGVLLRPLAYREPHQLLALFAHETSRDERRSPTSPADFLEWRKVSRTVEGLTAAHPWSPVLTGRGHAEELLGLKATPGLFDLLGVAPLLGRASDGDEDQVVLGHALWQRRFGGDPEVVGQMLVLDGRSHRVAAVMPPGFRFPPFWTEAELWVPLVFSAEQQAGHQRFLRVFGRLRRGATLAEARAEMTVIGERLAAEWPRSNADVRVNVEELQEPVVSRARPALLVLAGAVVLVLLIACANVASLLLAQGVAREREAAIRAALGASRARIVRQRLAESVAAALAGGLLGLALAGLAVRALARAGPIGLPRLQEIAVDGRVAAFSVALAVLTGIVSGLLPALRSSRPSLVPVLKQGERLAGGGSRHRMHDLLVVGELAMALVLLVGAGLLAQSFLRLQRPEAGFRAEGLLTVGLSFSGSPRAEPGRKPAALALLEETLHGLPGVERVAFVNHVPIGGDTWRTSFVAEGRPAADPADPPRAVMRTVSTGYLDAMGIPLAAGRALDQGDRADATPVILVNRTLAHRFWPEGDAVGRRIKLGRPDSDAPWRTVVGVFADARQADPAGPVEPEILFPYAQDPVGWYTGTTLVVRVRTRPRALAESVIGRVRSAAPEIPVTRVRTMPELLADAVAADRLGALLMGLLSLVATALAVGGIYGVMAYAVGRRTHELGLRLALGARPHELQAMVLRDGLRLGFLGAAVGLVGASLLSGLLRGLLRNVSPTDPLTFAAVGVFLLAVAGTASYLPARRAARLDPAAILREP